MSLRRPLVLIAFVAILALVLGCSGGNNSTPVTPGGSANSMDSLPIIGLTDANGVFDAIGVLGFFELNLDPETMVADLTAPRMASVGESFVVSAAGFFTVTPCPDCLDVKSLDIMGDGTIKVTWNISHPFPYGDDTLPPKANNRRDLDLFDLALVIAPTSEVATAFSTGGAYTQICADPDGYTADLATVADAPTWACPYFLVIDVCNAAPVDVTNNRFLMGTTDLEFDTLFNAGGKFKVYLTCGYGAAAKKATFLSPTYFIPEFNRKAAWKVIVTPPNGDNPPSSMNTWNNTNNDPINDVHTVKVEVYDWQQNSPIFSGDPLAYGTDAAVNEIYAASAVSQVTLEIPGMFNLPGYKIMNTADSGTGAPLSPLVFNFNVVNETLLPVGVYPSLVKVTDSRPGQDPLGGVETRDWVIDSPDGIALNHSALSEFAVYQVFEAAVVQFCGPITGSILTPGPITGVFDDGYAMVSALATSTNGGAPITAYQWDMDYSPLEEFDIDKTGANVALGPYDNPNCGGTNDPVTYTAACRALDSCVPPNILILGTIDIVVDDCSGAPVVPVTPVTLPSGDTAFDVAVAPGGFVYILADHPATGNTGGTASPNGTRTALQYPNNLSSMTVIAPGTGIVDPFNAYGYPWADFPGECKALAISTDGTILNAGVGRQLVTYLEVTGTTINPLQGTYAWCGVTAFTTTMIDNDVQTNSTLSEYLTGFGELPSPCASGSASPNGDQLTYILRTDYYTTGVSRTSTPEMDINNNFIAMSGMDGTNNTLLFMKGPDENCLAVFSAVGGWGAGGATETKYQIGTFAGDGLDVTIDSTGDILTLETPGIFRKFDNTFALVFVSPWLGPGIPLRAEYDTVDNELYVLSDTHITRCLVML